MWIRVSTSLFIYTIMKKIILLAFISLYQFTFSQTNNKLHVTYVFYNKNTNENADIELYIDKAHAFSEFINKNGKEKDSIFETETDLKISLKNNDTVGKQYYVTKDSILFRDHLFLDNKFTPVIVSENMPKYKWNLLDETLNIGDLLCQKTILKFRGRNFTVWYTEEIPTPFGPWKFYGLPGLIVRIITDDESIAFNLNTIESISEVKIHKPTLGKRINFKEYVELTENALSEFVNRMQTKMPVNTSITINKVNLNGIEKNFK